MWNNSEIIIGDEDNFFLGGGGEAFPDLAKSQSRGGTQIWPNPKSALIFGQNAEKNSTYL